MSRRGVPAAINIHLYVYIFTQEHKYKQYLLVFIWAAFEMLSFFALKNYERIIIANALLTNYNNNNNTSFLPHRGVHPARGPRALPRLLRALLLRRCEWPVHGVLFWRLPRQPQQLQRHPGVQPRLQQRRWVVMYVTASVNCVVCNSDGELCCM